MGAPTPILTAVYRGRTEELEALLAQRPALTLFEAAAIGDPAAVRAAVQADPAALAGRSADGWPALHLAAHFGHGDAVDALLKAGADVRALSFALINVLLAHGAAVEVRADDGRTALAIAEGRGHPYAARRLRGEMP
ncbi:MAG TPA: ankyrin repeat domain-containing protein [Methylomirabilota bacterium]|nr:ankyrin repeat domain-containing protein [Methylomirabilota bacterium]